MSDFNYIDLFAGIGSSRRAFDSVGGKAVFTSEWDKACGRTLRANYDMDHDISGDIKEFTVNDEALKKIPSFDCLCAGFPCQPFSIAGVSKKQSLGRATGFLDLTQGTLFFDVAKILSFHQPASFLLENVKNLISHDKGNTFKTIKRVLEDELGYVIHYKVIDARYWVPQHRERIFIVGFKRPTGFSFNDVVIPNSQPVLSSILHKPGDPDEAPYFINGSVTEKYTLSPKLWQFLQCYKLKHQARGNGFGYTLSGPNDVARTLSARYYKDGSEILVDQINNRPRRLTPRECSRLMGFDAFNESKFKIVNSDTASYKQFGNSAVVPLITSIAEAMKPHIMQVISCKKAKAA